MQEEVKRLAREAHRDKKAVRQIIIAKDKEVRVSIAEKASAIAIAQREQEEAAKRAAAAESALNKERQGQEAVLTHLRKQLAQRSKRAKALKLEVAEQRKAVSAGNRTLKRTVRQHGDELRSAIERLRKRLEDKDNELHLDRIANEERLVNKFI